MKKLLSFLIVFSLVFSIALQALAQDPPPVDPVFYDDEILSLMDNFEQLDSIVWYFSEVIGPALWGSPREKLVAEEVADLFREYGIEDVEVSELPRNINGSGSANSQPDLIIHDYTDPLAADFGYPITFDKGIAVARGSTDNASTRTGPEGVTGTIVYAGDGLTAADFPAATAGNIALIERRTKSAAQVADSYALAVAAGAKAVLFIAPEPAPRTDTPHTLQEPGFEATGPATGWPTAGSAGTAGWSTVTIAGATTPYAFVPDYAAKYLLEKPDTVVTYTMRSYNTFYQTVATIPGPSENSDIIIFTCHIDTVTASPGGNDNRTGMAAILELARVYQMLADEGKLDKEVVFAACGAEETGLVGSTAIANARTGTGFDAARRDRIIACYNFDMVAPADPWNAGMTLSLRQSYGTATAPIDDIVSINSIAAAERLGIPVVPIAERNNTGNLAIKLTNGGGSDHAPFGALGIPNANHSFRGTLNYPASAASPSGAWNATVPLESRYHTTGDLYWFNYSPERMEIALKVAAASSYAIARAEDVVRMSTDAHNVNVGDYFTIETAFLKEQASNAVILTYTFDGDLFEYANFTPADGVEVVNTEYGKGQAKITVISRNYDLQSFGALMLRAKEDAQLTKSFQTVALEAEYVLKDEAGDKTVNAANAQVSFTTFGFNEIPGDTNDDGIVDLIDLSNMIDWFGFDKTYAQWNTLYIFFDFNNSGDIDIQDIAYVAKLLQ